jgi:hypothetical protein
MPLRMEAYLIGHLDGLGEDVNLETRCAFDKQIGAHLPALARSGRPVIAEIRGMALRVLTS